MPPSPKERTWSRPRLCLLLTRALCRHDPIATLRAALRGGVDLVQIREKPFAEDAVPWCRRVTEICAESSVRTIVNDRLDLVAPSGAAGVHLGQEDLDAFAPGALRERTYLLGISTHDERERERALQHAPDYVGVGPCFPTETKGYAHANDRDWLRRSFADPSVPTLAIGGITPERLPALLELGARAIAVSSVILAADAPEAVAACLRQSLDTAQPY